MILISNLVLLFIVSVSHEKNKQMDLSTVHRLLATDPTAFIVCEYLRQQFEE